MDGLPVQLYFSDEMRYGLMSNFRRSWSKVGERAVLSQQQAFENRYLFSAVSPLSGDSFHLMGIDDMDGTAMTVFLTELKKQRPHEHVVVIWDRAPCHRLKSFREIPGLSVVFLPSYSPELNPAERFFEELRRETANRIFEGLEKIEAVLARVINRWADDTVAMKQLLGYEWILEQCRTVI